MDRFEPFSPTHAAVVITFVALVTSLVTARRQRRSDPARARGFDRAIGATAFVAFVAVNAWPMLPRHFRLDWSLPLHVCDIVTLCVPIAIATSYRPTRVLVYFWGLALCTQGLVTPDLQDGPANVGFWTFWLAHFCVVGGALYDVAGRGYRPTWRDYRLAVFISLAYVAVILPVDLWLGVNYGYLGRGTPGQATIVEALGPWPWRAVVMVMLGLAGMALLMVPWEVAVIWRSRRGGSAGIAAGRAAGSE